MQSPSPHAEPGELREAISGLSYPVSKDAALRFARDHGGLDHEVADTLAQIPDRSYESQADLVAALRAVYLLEGVPPDATPI
ncbi:MAG: DUF2795 domain-containing protein [Chloroflexota bacterium]